ncbi:hypothetical protein FRX52_03225 [Streptococcus sp. sy018]|nr:hypothetical protein FRX52_03225 [Streptococcus sp. sy018]
MSHEKIVVIAFIGLILIAGLIWQTKTIQGVSSKVTSQQVERNKKNALAFYQMVFNDHKVRQATETYVADTYIQHNPTVDNGPEAFIKVFETFVKDNPESSVEVKRVAAEGDLVFVHVYSKANKTDKGEAVVDIFRFDDQGKIVEHWDVIQPVVEETVSGNSMF